MAKFAVGKHAYGICDRSGFRYKLNEMRKEWNGSLVGRDMWEAKHPQLEPRRKVSDAQALRQPRPDVAEGPTTQLLPANPFWRYFWGILFSGTAQLVYVTHFGHGKEVGDTVVFSNAEGFANLSRELLNRPEGWTVASVVDENRYSITFTNVDRDEEGPKLGGGSRVTVGV